MPTVTVAPLVFPPDFELSTRKAAVRASMRALRRDLLDQRGSELAMHLAEQARHFSVPTPKSVVAGYWPLEHELDPRPLLWRLRDQGWSLALPVVVAKGQPLLFRSYQPGDRLLSGPFGVQQPDTSATEVTPDLVLVPMLAFDRHGHRLGYGGGFYDRTLAHVRQLRQITAVGLALLEQGCALLPVDETDQRLDGVMTPFGWA